MFQFLKGLLWTGCAVGLGVWLATGHINGKTPLEHAQRWWSNEDSLRTAVGNVTDRFNTDPKHPRDRYSADERKAVDELIAKRSRKTEK